MLVTCEVVIAWTSPKSTSGCVAISCCAIRLPQSAATTTGVKVAME
jgi:hypothetical protein